MSKVKKWMTTETISVDPDDSIEKAISLMLKHRLSGLPVVDASGCLLGMISEFDLLELLWDPKTSQDRVYHYMSRQLYTMAEDDDVTAAAEAFRIRSIRRLPVTRDGRLVGMISRSDLLRRVHQSRGQVAPVVPQVLSPAHPLLAGPAAL